MRRPARRCRQRRAACAHRSPPQHAFAVRTNHSAAFLTPTAVRPSTSPSSSANPSRRFAFALRSFPAAPSAHHSPSASPPSSANPSHRFAFALRSFSTAPLSRRPPSASPLSSAPPSRRFAFALRSFPAAPLSRRPPSASPPSSAPPSRRFAFALRSFPPRRAPTTAHYRLQPQTHRAVSHSPFAVSPAAPLAPSSAIPIILRPSPCRFSRLDSPGASSDPQNRKSGRDIHPCPQ